MAKEEIVYSVSVDSNKAGKSLSDLKKEFKESQKELSNLVEGTKEYNLQLQKLGALKDDIGDLNTTIKAFNPEGKIKAIGSAVSGLAGGFAAAQGAIALFGGENENLEKTLVKVQAAMAFQQGIEGIIGLGDSFKVLWQIVKANPLGAIVTALALIAAGVALFVESMDKSSEATKSLTKELETQKEITTALSRATDRQVALLKSQGASELEIIAIKQKLTQQQILELETGIALHQSKINDIRDNNNLYESYLQVAAGVYRKIGNEKLANETEQLILTAKLARAKEEIDAIKAEKEQLLDLKNQVAILSNEKITAQNKATENYVNNLKKEREATIAHDLEMAKLRAAQAEYEAIQNEKDFAAAIAEDDKRILDLQTTLATEKEINDFKIADAERVAAEKDAIQKESFDRTIQTAQATTQSLSDLSNLYFDIASKNATKGSARELALAKKRFQINKALAISSNIISTIVGITNALSATSVIPDPFGTILKVANAAAIGISGTVATAKIASQKFNEGGGSAGGSGGSVSLPTPSVSPPTQGGTQLNSDGTIKQAEKSTQQPIKAYVVETEVSKTQKKVSSIETNAKL
jgi:hypothetical protein